MFWSKIWLFLVALGAAAALTVALALPPAAHRERVRDERQRLATACDVVGIELELAARNHVDLIGTFARAAEIVGGLEQVDPGMPLDAEKGKRLRQTAGTLVSQIKVAGADPDAPTPPGLRPNFAWMLDASGRAVARWGLDEDDTGDVLAGRWLVDDALAGYLRDDVWLDKGTLYMVAGAPVVSRGDKGFVGAVLMGWRLDLDVSAQFVQAFKDTDQDAEDRSINIGFFGGGKAITKSSRDVNLDSDILDRYGAVDKPEEMGEDCRRIAPFFAHDGKHEYAVTVARLPGEIASQDGFFALYTPRPAAPSFGAAVGKAKHELGGGFPWALVIVGFVVAFAGGVVLMVLEADRPLRRLQADAVKLAKGDGERMAEDQHHGRFGSIARSVNIQIDKVSRDAKAAKKDLDQLLGPAPEGSLGAVDLLGGVPPSPSLPGMSLPPRPAAPAAPPPSEFRFGDQGAAPARPAAGP
ncbi:MAG: hypothetical protein H6708_16930 [Kofleriaceae bacterium]|nr:hypothetical protein [Kofleriaceae bacterium]